MLDSSGIPTPDEVPMRTRLRRLPEALLLAAGYYASRAPVISDLIRRMD